MRPAALGPSDAALLTALSSSNSSALGGETYPNPVIEALRLLMSDEMTRLADSLSAPAPPGTFPQNPLVSVPTLVSEVSLALAVIGAIILLAIYRLIKGRRS